MNNNYASKKKQLQSLSNVGDFQYTIDQGSKIIGHAIASFDTSYNLIAYSKDISTDDWLWNELTTTGGFSHETVNFFNSQDFILAFAKSDIVAVLKSKHLKYERMNGKLFDKDGIQLANISVVAAMQPFADYDHLLIEQLCDILSKKLWKSGLIGNINKVYTRTPINDLLEGKSGKKGVKEAVDSLYCCLKPNLYLAVIDTTGYENTATHLAYFSDILKRISPQYKYYEHLNNIVAIISVEDNLSPKRDLGKLNDFFAKNNIAAGVSAKFLDLDELKKYYIQAINALNYGIKSKRKGNIFYYDSFKGEHFLTTQVEGLRQADILSPVLADLQASDKAGGTDFYNTLYKFFLYGCDRGLTCQALGITRQELKKALDGITRKFNIDLKDGNSNLNLFLSMKLLCDA